MTRIRFSLSALLIATCAVAGCRDPLSIVPDEGSLELITPNRDLKSGGDTVTVRALLLYSDKSIAGAGWHIDFFVTGGTLDESRNSVRKLTDDDGAASILVRTNSTPGTLIITARSGGMERADTLTVQAPTPASSALSTR